MSSALWDCCITLPLNCAYTRVTKIQTRSFRDQLAVSYWQSQCAGGGTYMHLCLVGFVFVLLPKHYSFIRLRQGSHNSRRLWHCTAPIHVADGFSNWLAWVRILKRTCLYKLTKRALLVYELAWKAVQVVFTADNSVGTLYFLQVEAIN